MDWFEETYDFNFKLFIKYLFDARKKFLYAYV
jgi:hypothetical protein